jgi:hypothetical protein
VKPVAGGGLPLDLLRVEVKLTFKDGGHSDFQSKFELIKERLHHARELELETGQTLNVTDEPLPPYEASHRNTESRGVARPPGQSQPPPAAHPAPDEPPPNYVEAQAQAIGIQYEERTRDEAERH